MQTVFLIKQIDIEIDSIGVNKLAMTIVMMRMIYVAPKKHSGCNLIMSIDVCNRWPPYSAFTDFFLNIMMKILMLDVHYMTNICVKFFMKM